MAILLVVGIILAIRIMQKRKIYDDTNKISSHKDNKIENLLYNTN